MQNIRKNVYLQIAFSISLIILGGIIVRSSSGVPVTRWMLIYEPSDFQSLQDLKKFILELRVPIPPLIASLEILTYQISGSIELITSAFYRVAIVGSFILALQLASESNLRMCATFIVSIFSMYGIVNAHKFNPQLYDVLFPFFLLLFFYLLSQTKESSAKRGNVSLLTAFMSGLSLALAELTRPFFIIILPFIIIGIVSFLGLIRWREIVLLILPVLLLSGIWHAHLWIRYRQILWSNHAGFNLALAWPQVDTSQVQLVEEDNNEPLAEGRWPNINTEEHAINSRLLSTEVFRYIQENPIDSVRYLGLRFLGFFVQAGPMHKSSQPLIIGFSAYIHFALAYVSANLATLFLYAIASKLKIFKLLGNIDNLVIFTISATLFITAIGSVVEESRLVLSVVPLLAALPYVKLVDEENLVISTRVIAIITISIGILTLLFNIAGQQIQGFGYGENFSRFERSILYFIGIFFIVFGPAIYILQRKYSTNWN